MICQRQIVQKYHFLTPYLETPKISLPKVEKPMSGTEFYHHANFHTNRREISVPGHKYIFLLIGDSLGATVPCYTFLESSR